LTHSPRAIEFFGFHPAAVALKRDDGAAGPESQNNILKILLGSPKLSKRRRVNPV
jgi:hypothetical protein